MSTGSVHLKLKKERKQIVQQLKIIIMEEKFMEQFAEAIDLMDSSILKRETIFRELEEWDSLAFLSVIAFIDEEYDVIIEGIDFKNLITIGEVIDEIEKRKK